MKLLVLVFASIFSISFFIVPINAQTVDTFSIRIADFMPVRITQPDMDNPVYWQPTLDDLAVASPNGEITHVQLRLYWHCRYNSGPPPAEPTNAEWNNPQLGSTDGQADGTSQWEVMQNWRSWYFCNPVPASGKCAIQRIREAGFKVEIGLSASFLIEENIPPAMMRHAREANFPNWNGSLFIENYWNNVLKPVAEQARDSGLLEAGDIFFIGFENYQEDIDHCQLHSPEYSNIIAQLRAILPPGVIISEHTSSWYLGSGWEDTFLGLNQTGHIRAVGGLLNHNYYADLDLLEMSNWNAYITSAQLPTNRNDVAQGHFTNMNGCQRGTGYGGVPCVLGRNIMQDFQTLYDRFGTPILLNTGYQNCYGTAASDVGRCLGGRNETEQAEAWAGRLLALKMAIEQGYEWVAGQDFERYCEDISGGYTTYPVASWRNRPAQDEIINGIRDILNQTPTATTTTSSTTTTIPTGQVSISGQLRNSTGTIQANISVYNRGTDRINISQITTNGNYNFGILPGIYDLQFNILKFFIQNFFIKLMSFNVNSNLVNVINYMTGYPSENKVSFRVNIIGNQGLQVYSEQKPNSVKVNGTEMTEVSSLPVSANTWFYDSTGKRLHMIANPTSSTTTTTSTSSTTSTTTSSTTTTTLSTKTFGNQDTSGTLGTLLSDYLSGVYYTAPENGIVTSMRAYIGVTSACDVACAIYNDTDDSLIRSTSVNTVPVQGYTWTTFNFLTGQEPSIVAGQNYIFICWSNGNATLRYQTEADRSRYRLVGVLTFPNWPNPGIFGSGDRRHAIYVTYT